MLKVSWFPELLPQEKIIEEKILNIIKNNYQKTWFTPIETPAVERNSVLTAKWGGEVSKQIFWLYGLAQWCEKDTKDYSLHFDLTVPFARYVIDHKNDLVFPFKRSQIQKVWRWERAQRWRFREFYQADIDVIWKEENRWKSLLKNNNIITDNKSKITENSQPKAGTAEGSNSLWWEKDNLWLSNKNHSSSFLLFDAEVIFTLVSTLKDIFREFNLKQDVVVNVNNKKIIAWFIWEYLGLNDILTQVTTIIDKKDKISEEKFIEELKNLSLNNEQINKILEFTQINDLEKLETLVGEKTNELLQSWIAELNAVLDYLKIFEVDVKVNLGIMRGLDYYTGIVFETFIEWERKLGSIASWWRYENFTKALDTKTNFSGVGGSIWVSRLEAFIFENVQNKQKTTSEYMIVNFSSTQNQALQLYKRLLENDVKVEFYPNDDKLGKQFKYADKKWIKFVIILWEDELQKWVYQVKNMETWTTEEYDLEGLDSRKLIC